MYLESILLLASVAVAVPYLLFTIVISLMDTPTNQDERKTVAKSKQAINSSALVTISRAQKTTTIVAPPKAEKTTTLVYRGAPVTKDSSTEKQKQ